MAEFVQNYHIQKFLSLSNDQECNIFDRKLFGLTEIRNPGTQVGAIDEHRHIDEDEDEDEDEPHCDDCRQTHACPNNVMTEYITKVRDETSFNLSQHKRIPLIYNAESEVVISTNVKDYFTKPVYLWFPETWVNNGELKSLNCPNCMHKKLTRNQIRCRNVECINTNAFVLFSQFKCLNCDQTFDALTNTEKILKYIKYCLTLMKKGNGRINYEAVANAYSKRFEHQRHANQLRFTWGNIKKKLGIK
jgi:hypothetical protein